jgi:hypothetical protein
MADEYADPARHATLDDRSVLTGRTLAEVAAATPVAARAAT